MSGSNPAPSNWWMFHADPEHSGHVTGSSITSANVAGMTWKDVALDGPILSTPAVVDGYVYVGTANSQEAIAANGGSFFKIDVETGAKAAEFHWHIAANEADTHGFCGMGSTPAVSGGKVYFSAFNGKLYCLDQADLSLVWVTDLRHADMAHNQPVMNTLGIDHGMPPVAGWSSPLAVGGRVYVGMGEGENPLAYGFVYCLAGDTGDVEWLFCTNQFEEGKDNAPNVVPADVFAAGGQKTQYSEAPRLKLRGASVWAGIAYDQTLNRLYCSTGNPSPDGPLPTQGYTNGLLTLDASDGTFRGFRQFPADSSYRPTDIDVDVGGAPMLFTDAGSARRVALGGKNGGFMVMDADTLEICKIRQLLPYFNNGGQIPTVDPHGTPQQDSEMNPRVSNDVSNANQGENYSGTYSTAAIHPESQRLFIGVGGNNYHPLAPGIDTPTTPFLRALDAATLDDAWELDDSDPRKYMKPVPPMYTNATESGLSVPAVVNDVVFMATTNISVYAFAVADGTTLFQNQLGAETGGYNGGYGYCLGPAVWGDYVVAGALLYGRDGGLLRIFKVPSS